MNIDEYVEKLSALVNIDCGSRNKEGICKVADYLSEWYRQIGWNIVTHDVSDKTGPVLEIYNNTNDNYDALFIGHMDTVFPDGTVDERPFKRVDNLCFGPGVEDMKSGDLAMYYIAKDLADDLKDLNICMLYNPDEEISSIYSADLLKKIAAKSKRVFIMESSQDDGKGHVCERKGKSNYLIEFHGIPCHAGFIFKNPNASAIEEMAHYITVISSLKNIQKDTSVNVGVVNGGTVVNAVADYAYMELEFRYTELNERDRINKVISDLINGEPFVKGVKASVKNKYETPPWIQSEEGWKYINRVKGIAQDLEMEFEIQKRGGLSDANHLAEVCPYIIDGMGPFGAFAHSDKEYMDLNSVEPCIKLINAILKDIKNGS